MSLANRIGSVVNSWLHPKGLHLGRTETSADLGAFLQRLGAGHNGLNVVYDIGANDGQWTKRVSKWLPRDTHFVLFEGGPGHVVDLRKISGTFHEVVLAGENNEVNWFGAGGLGDSMYPERGGETVQPHTVKTAVRLDDYVRENALPLPDLIKADTQGSELDVLRGGQDCLSHARAVILEAPVVEYNLGAPSMSDYLRFMDSANFVPVAITEIHLMHAALVQLDVAFLSKELFDEGWKSSP